MNTEHLESMIEQQFKRTEVNVNRFWEYLDIASHLDASFSLGNLLGMLILFKLIDTEKYEAYMLRYNTFNPEEVRDWRKE